MASMCRCASSHSTRGFSGEARPSPSSRGGGGVRRRSTSCRNFLRERSSCAEGVQASLHGLAISLIVVGGGERDYVSRGAALFPGRDFVVECLQVAAEARSASASTCAICWFRLCISSSRSPRPRERGRARSLRFLPPRRGRGLASARPPGVPLPTGAGVRPHRPGSGGGPGFGHVETVAANAACTSASVGGVSRKLARYSSRNIDSSTPDSSSGSTSRSMAAPSDAWSESRPVRVPLSWRRTTHRPCGPSTAIEPPHGGELCCVGLS